MSTRCTVLDGGPFHLFIEAQLYQEDLALTLSISGEENKWSGGTFINKDDLIQFVKQIIYWAETGEELKWVHREGCEDDT